MSDEAGESGGGGLEKGLEVKISDDDVYFEPPRAVYAFSRYVCQITATTLNGSAVKGTGFLVGPDLVLTCFHVIEDVKAKNLECRFDVKVTELGIPNWGLVFQ